MYEFLIPIQRCINTLMYTDELTDYIWGSFWMVCPSQYSTWDPIDLLSWGLSTRINERPHIICCAASIIFFFPTQMFKNFIHIFIEHSYVTTFGTK